MAGTAEARAVNPALGHQPVAIMETGGYGKPRERAPLYGPGRSYPMRERQQRVMAAGEKRDRAKAAPAWGTPARRAAQSESQRRFWKAM